MYQPKKYRKKDPLYIFNFIKAHPFATFVLKGERLLATHIPVLITGTPDDFVLYAHIANHNEQFSFLKDGLEALLIFQGAHGYVSSSWYKEKDISTWDYSAVHVNVKLKIQTAGELESSLDDLVAKFEKNQEKPLFFQDYPRDIVEEHLPLITGFWCNPFKVEAVAKLHQGYDKEDIGSVTRHLEKMDDPLATQLSKNIKEENN
ncbi:FMN-binding negative transcriptional regulator [Antarcticibacterium arcticum]|uniref:FMN-binding negative transcriptional regulator n=2 Tax=Antarcticibacterium arcticum TaxID=2585771 RepID=A0A5B8YME2_9FLAO|nr:FMN-binding negative transcriptional regulator [Antarcticibacterium arcticum]